MNHYAHLARLLDAHLRRRPPVVDRIDHLDLGVVVTRAERAELRQAALLRARLEGDARGRVGGCKGVFKGRDGMQGNLQGCKGCKGCKGGVRGVGRAAPRAETALASAPSMRPYSSQCSLSSAQL